MLSMLKTLKIDQIHIRAVMPVMLCMSKMSKMEEEHTHTFFAHNFLNIQPIFNLQKVLESWDLELFKHIHTHFAQHHLQSLWHTYHYIAFNALKSVLCTFDTFNIALIFCTIFHTCIQCYVCYVFQHFQNQTMCIDMRPLMYTQQIRWQWVWVSGFLTT